MAEAGKPRYEFDIKQLSATKHVIKRPFQKHPAQSDYSCIAEIYYLVKTHCNSILRTHNIISWAAFVRSLGTGCRWCHVSIIISATLSTVSGFNYLKIFMSWDGSRVCCFYLFFIPCHADKEFLLKYTGRQAGRQACTRTLFQSTSLLEAKVNII